MTRKIQAPRTAEALRQAFPYVEGGLNLQLAEEVVPVAVVADLADRGGPSVPYAQAVLANWTPLAGDTVFTRLQNPTTSGVLATVQLAELRMANNQPIWAIRSVAPLVITDTVGALRGTARTGPPRTSSASIFSWGSLAAGVILDPLPIAALRGFALQTLGGWIQDHFVTQVTPGSSLWVICPTADAAALSAQMNWNEVPLSEVSSP